jgi:hypothetical protein
VSRAVGRTRRSVHDWIDAAERARDRARHAAERAARATDEQLAVRFEREATLQMRAARNFEKVALLLFEWEERELAAARSEVRATASVEVRPRSAARGTVRRSAGGEPAAR